MATKESKIKPGDVIYRNMDLNSKTKKSTIGNHYGVCIGDGQVIDFSPEGIKEKSLEEFESGSDAHVRSYPKTLPRDVIVEKAIYQLKNKEEWGKYNLVFNNCEHFACSCATGEKKSGQVKKAVIVGAYAVAVIEKVTIDYEVAARVTLELVKDKGGNDKNDDVSLIGLGVKVVAFLWS